MIKRVKYIGVLIGSFGLIISMGMAQTQKEAQVSNSLSESTTLIPALTASNEQPKFFYDSKGKPDPMAIPWYHKELVRSTGPGEKPVEVQLSIQESLKGKLTGIVYSETNPASSCALIGEQIVNVGDAVIISQLSKSAKVFKINKQDIIIIYEGKTYPVKFAGN
jgi:type II secretory pathway component PulC